MKITLEFDIPVDQDEILLPTHEQLERMNVAIVRLFGPDVEIDWRDVKTVEITTTQTKVYIHELS